MNKRGFLFVFLLVIIAINFVSATFTVDLNSSDLRKTYSIGDYIGGNIAITFSNESANSTLTTNLGGSYTLKEWLEMSEKKKNIDYQCSVTNCEASYKSIGNNPSVTISLTESKSMGFALSGSNISIQSISLKAQTSLPNSCSKQFSMGVFDTEKYVLENYLSSGGVCGAQKRGCFDSTLETNQYQLANLTSTEYCELISLSPAPGYKVGSSVSGPQGPLKEKIKMRLYNDDFTIIYGTCDLPVSGEQQECDLEYPISRESSYYLCVSSNLSNSVYQIRTESKDQKCGVTSASKSSPSTIDFDMWAQPLEYSSSQITFDYDKFALLNFEANFTKIANEYLKEQYGSSCLNTECYLPFKVVGQSQTISFSDAIVVYEGDGVIKTRTQLDEITRDDGTITSGKIILSLDKLKIPISKKSSLLQVNINGKSIIKSNIEVSPSQIEISPGFALIGVPTKFKLISNLTINQAQWNFGAGTTLVSGLEAAHTFSTAGSYNVDVSATTAEGTVLTRTKNVVVGEPKASAEEIIEVTENSIETINGQINSLPLWIRTGVQENIDPIKLNASLLEIKSKYLVATTNAEYISIVGEVQALNVPSTIGTVKSGKFPLISGYGTINTEYAKELDSSDFSDAQLKTAITEWLRDNYNPEVEIETTGANFASGTESVLTRIKITTNPLLETQTQRYLIIDAPFESVYFMSGYSQKELAGGTYLPLENGQQVIEFYIKGDLGIENLGVYILPSLSELRQGGYSYEVVGSNADKRSKTLYISLSILIILLVGIAFALQYWYRNSYEKHLFPKNEELYNIMTFIYNSQKAGLKEGDIRKNLLTSGWTREQISYALGRLKGRIFGLFGLPIYSNREEKRVRNEIETRQGRK